MAEENETFLLFFETFVHERRELTLDCVQFKHPVVINEVRVVPLGCSVKLDLQLGTRMGATNPNSFKLEMYVVDLNTKERNTFGHFGILDYEKNKNIQFFTNKRVPTDSLVLKGVYSTVTVAVYGHETTVAPDCDTPPPPPPPQQTAPKPTPSDMPRPAAIATTNTDMLPSISHTFKVEQWLMNEVQDGDSPSVDLPSTNENASKSRSRAAMSPHGEVSYENSYTDNQSNHELDAPKVIPLDSDVHHEHRERDYRYEERNRDDYGSRRDSSGHHDRHHDRSSSPQGSGRGGYRDKYMMDRPLSPPNSGRGSYRDRHHSPLSPRRCSPSPHSPRRRSISSRSPRRRSSSPVRRPHSPRHRSGSPLSPRLRSVSPQSPLIRSRSPHRRSRSPRRRQISPRGGSTRSPRRRSVSPGYRVQSPRRSLSPQGSGRGSYREKLREDRDSHVRRRDRDGEKDRDRVRSRDERERGRERLRDRGSKEDWQREKGKERYASPEKELRELRGRERDSDVMDDKYFDVDRIHDEVSVQDTESDIGSNRRIKDRRASRGRSASPEPWMRSVSRSPVRSRVSTQPSGEERRDTESEDNDDGDIYSKLDEIGKANNSEGEMRDVYEEISSSDSNFDADDQLGDNINVDWDYYDNFSPSMNFNAYQFELAPLEAFADPSLTNFELDKLKLISMKSDVEMPLAASKLQDIVETYKDTEHTQKWVEAMEEASSLLVPGLVYLINKKHNEDVLDHLILWALEGVNLELAIKQPEVVYKVRHLKMGVRLTAALTSCDSYTAFRILTQDVQHKLIDLYTSQYMSPPVKLLIVGALDQTTRLKDGMDWFLGTHHLQIETGSCLTTPYQRIIELALKEKTDRCIVALSALIQKTHLYETLLTLTKTSYEITEHSRKAEDLSEADLDDTSQELQNLLDDKFDNIIICLNKIIEISSACVHVIAQPRRTLPAQVKFEVSPDRSAEAQTHANLFQMFNATGLLESVFVLISSPAMTDRAAVFMAVQELLCYLMDSRGGLLYLSSKVEVVNNIIRVFIQNPDFRDDGMEESGAQNLGMKMIYNLQTIQLIDQLKDYHAKDTSVKNLDDTESLSVLYNFSTLTMTSQGRQAVVHIMCMEDNISQLMPFIKISGDPDTDAAFYKSATIDLVLQLLLLLVRNASSMSVFTKYSTLLSTLSDAADLDTKHKDRLSEIADWLRPLRVSCDPENLSEPANQMKQFKEEGCELNGALVTVCRMIRDIIVPGKVVENAVVELKHKYAMVELYSKDTFANLATILQKVSCQFLQAWNSNRIASNKSLSLLIAFVKPALCNLQQILSQLIEARGSKYSDMTYLTSLFQVYTLFKTLSQHGVFFNEANEIQRMVIEILLAFTQPTLQHAETAAESEEALTGSLWTKMIKELLKFTELSPDCFLGGIHMLSELLPLPLPVQTKEEPRESEVTLVVNQRKLWAAHLHPLVAELQHIIRILAGTQCQPLQQVLRRICWQIADLSAVSSLIVMRCLFDALLESMDQSIVFTPQPEVENEVGELESSPPTPTLEQITSSVNTSQILCLIAFLAGQLKSAMLMLTRPGSKSDEKYLSVLPRMGQVLNYTSEKKTLPPHHIQGQEAIVSILQTLCDYEVTLIPADTELSIDTQLACCLPTKDQLSIILGMLVNHLGQMDQKYSTVLPSLRTLLLLTYHDYGFYHLCSALEVNLNGLLSLLQRLNDTFSKEDSECIATVTCVTDLIHLLIKLPDPTNEQDNPQQDNQQQDTMDNESIPDLSDLPFKRTQTLSTLKVRQLLKWDNYMEDHPLIELLELLQAYAADEEMLKAVYLSVKTVADALKTGSPNHDDSNPSSPPADLVEPVLPPCESIPNQYTHRVMFEVCECDDERLSTHYWQSIMAPDQDVRQHMVKLNFEEMAEIYCPTLDLKAEIMRGTSEQTVNKVKKRRLSRKPMDTINTSTRRQGGSFVAPMRGGRGFGRGHSSSRGDMFRSRPPNTSRPPSMHVDEFVKMENKQQSDNSYPDRPTQQTLPPPKPYRSSRGGRGFERGPFERGPFGDHGRKFFNNSQQYNRHESQDSGRAHQGASYLQGGSGSGGDMQRSDMNQRNDPNRGDLRNDQRGDLRNDQRGDMRNDQRGGDQRGDMVRQSPLRGGTWQQRTPRHNTGFRNVQRNDWSQNKHSNRPMSADRRPNMGRNQDGVGFMGRGGRGGWSSRQNQAGGRFMGAHSGGGSFMNRRDRGKHQRAFTK